MKMAAKRDFSFRCFGGRSIRFNRRNLFDCVSLDLFLPVQEAKKTSSSSSLFAVITRFFFAFFWATFNWPAGLLMIEATKECKKCRAATRRKSTRPSSLPSRSPVQLRRRLRSSSARNFQFISWPPQPPTHTHTHTHTQHRNVLSKRKKNRRD